MLSTICFVLFALFYTGNGAEDGYIPDYIKPCEYNPSTFSDCIKRQIQEILPHFTKGVPQLDVPSLDPVQLDDIVLKGNGLDMKFTNAAMHGVSRSIITQLKVDVGKNEDTFSITFKGNFTLIAQYVVDGRILVLPIQGKGDARVKARNIEVHINSKLARVKTANGLHLKLNTPTYKYTIENTRFELDNLFNGNKQLSDVTHQFANENWQQLMDELAPPAIKQIVRTCVKAINKFFANVTAKQIVTGYKE